MYRVKLIIIVFTLILLCFGLIIWANTTELNLVQKKKINQISSFEECSKAGFPVQESYPRRCAVPGGETFTEKLSEDEEPFLPDPSGGICVNRCGDGFCAEIVCQGSGCPCAETINSCPQDCR